MKLSICLILVPARHQNSPNACMRGCLEACNPQEKRGGGCVWSPEAARCFGQLDVCAAEARAEASGSHMPISPRLRVSRSPPLPALLLFALMRWRAHRKLSVAAGSPQGQMETSETSASPPPPEEERQLLSEKVERELEAFREEAPH